MREGVEVCDVVYAIERPDHKKTDGKEHFFPVVGKAFIRDNRVEIKLTSVPCVNWDGALLIFRKGEEG